MQNLATIDYEMKKP